ncbi:MAG TPA: redox-regulated ATPase YchF [Nanoarchaeota archaeon]|nr:redox-regulated ATPase YchF [Candidatus Woesearchaeota archaeon]HIH15467.1 redox-regulated ATPase YchF [Nanoarchaeota archaeon]HIH59270.1 redox-regulated ATPase YchF [Nanoarchaeota archaeon]HII13935.1 redox-regulated ATPase YchF [Nanoarchaeota archaeon]HIJ04693.1 redox-regulated ATPase YchF [Nanoarchaeota archaeon]
MLIGVVGKPSTGKSTFFKAITLAEVEIANYPFTTIKPNHAVGYIRIACADKDFATQCHPRMGYCIDHQRFLPVDLLDVAGLVPGASEGLGMGNAFLDDLNQADALIHVIDLSGSTNEKGEPVIAGSYDPINDVLFLDEELDLWYLRLLNKGWEKFARQVKQENANIFKAIAKQLSGLRVTEDIAKEAVKHLQLSDVIEQWNAADLRRLASYLRSVTKPMIIAANKADIAVAKNNLKRLQERFPERMIIPCSAESELALKGAAKKDLIRYVPGNGNFSYTASVSDVQKNALDFIDKNILQQYGSTGVQKVLDSVVLDVLKYIAIFPGGVNKLEDKDGNVLPDCFLMKDGSTALDFAFRLHTDIGNAFIRAIDVRTKRTVGKEHLLKHRDVVEIIVRK